LDHKENNKNPELLKELLLDLNKTQLKQTFKIEG